MIDCLVTHEKRQRGWKEMFCRRIHRRITIRLLFEKKKDLEKHSVVRETLEDSVGSKTFPRANKGKVRTDQLAKRQCITEDVSGVVILTTN